MKELNDPWPKQSKAQKKRTLKAIKEAAKAGVFDDEPFNKRNLNKTIDSIRLVS